MQFYGLEPSYVTVLVLIQNPTWGWCGRFLTFWYGSPWVWLWLWPLSEVLPPRFDISRVEIEQVVAAFYKRIRNHPVLGTIFAKSIANTPDAWAPHEDKIARFWANAILHEHIYVGNPMAVHMATPHISLETRIT